MHFLLNFLKIILFYEHHPHRRKITFPQLSPPLFLHLNLDRERKQQ
jgi:hypothetical protein